MLELEPVAQRLAHRGLEEPIAAAVLFLGGIEGEVGALQQLLGVAAVVGRDRDADRKTDLGRAVPRAAAAACSPRPGSTASMLASRASAPTSITTANSSPPMRAAMPDVPVACSMRPATCLRSWIAGGVAERVVDRLEAVEVDDEERKAAEPLGLGEALRQPLAQHVAVGEPGQRVVIRRETPARPAAARIR